MSQGIYKKKHRIDRADERVPHILTIHYITSGVENTLCYRFIVNTITLIRHNPMQELDVSNKSDIVLHMFINPNQKKQKEMLQRKLVFQMYFGPVTAL